MSSVRKIRCKGCQSVFKVRIEGQEKKRIRCPECDEQMVVGGAAAPKPKPKQRPAQSRPSSYDDDYSYDDDEYGSPAPLPPVRSRASSKKKKKKKKSSGNGLLYGVIGGVVALLLIVSVVLGIVLMRGGDNDPAEVPATVAQNERDKKLSIPQPAVREKTKPTDKGEVRVSKADTGIPIGQPHQAQNERDKKLSIPQPAVREKTKPTTDVSKFLNPDFIEKRLAEISIDRLIDEYASESDKNVQTIKATLDLSRHILKDHPDSLREQLQARLISRKEPVFAGFQTLPNERIQFHSEWATFDQSGGALLRTLTGHSNYVYCLALTPDGKQAISGSRDKALKVWDITTGKLLRTLAGRSNCVAVTPDGKQAISWF